MNQKVNNLRLNRKQFGRFLACTLLYVLVSGCLLVYLYNLQLQQDKTKAFARGEGIVANILTELRRCTDTTEIMTHLYRADSTNFINDFRKICSELQEGNLAIGSMYWAPKGVIQYAYPDEVDEATRNFEMLKDPVQGPKAIEARDSHKTTIAGPHNLIEGGKGLIIRNPVYSKSGEFEAFAIMVIDTKVFLKQVIENISDEEHEYRFSVWKEPDATASLEEGDYVFSNDKPIQEREITIDFAAPNDTWHLTIEPLAGWTPLQNMAQAIFVVLLILFCALAITYAYLKNLQMKHQIYDAEVERKRLQEVQHYQNEQKVQLQEIKQLNTQLKEEKENISSLLGIIRAFSQDYHTIWLVDTDTLKMRLMRSSEKKTLLGTWVLDIEDADFDKAFSQYIDRYVVESERERMRHDISSKEVLHHLSLSNHYAVNFLRQDEEGQFAYHQIAFNNADATGKKQFVFGLRDIDDMLKKEKAFTQELEDARRAADAANRAKTLFLNNMSHDIRTPMNAILGFATLMEKQKDNPKLVSEYLQKMRSSGEYLLNIINNVLDLARIDSGHVIVEEVFSDLKDEKNFVFPMFESLIRNKHQNITVNDEIEHRYVFTDGVKINQIMANLLSNAIKYTPDGGTITLKRKEVPSPKEGYARFLLTITDTGIGMSPEFLEHIFDHFSRERNTTESKIIGTGLGMSIVKKLVELMGGTITVESEKGVGSTFTVTIDCRIAENPEDYLIPIGEESTENINIEGTHVLLAEDNEINAEIATAILDEIGIITTHVLDGQQCVNKLVEAPAGTYQLILMDIQMPNMNGYEASMAIRQLEDAEKANIPIVAMTANAFEEDKQNALKAGMNGHLSKPIEIPKLIYEIKRALSYKS